MDIKEALAIVRKGLDDKHAFEAACVLADELIRPTLSTAQSIFYGLDADDKALFALWVEDQ